MSDNGRNHEQWRTHYWNHDPSNNTHPKTRKEVHYNDYVIPILLKIRWHMQNLILLLTIFRFNTYLSKYPRVLKLQKSWEVVLDDPF